MFDISERKKMDEELLALNRKLEALSLQDGLIGVANRRLFDQTLKSEPASLFAVADRMLYQAKESGCNRVVSQSN
jgi:PleD family two-component response regulator